MPVYILWETTVTPQQTIANHGTTKTYLIRYTQCHNTIRQSGTTKGKYEIRIYSLSAIGYLFYLITLD